MKTQFIKLSDMQGTEITHVISDDILIKNEQDILDLIGETGFAPLILHDHNFEPVFFDLSTRILGNVMQKLANYQVKMSVIGDFSQYSSQVLPDFIRESNRVGRYLFVPSLAEVKQKWGLVSS